jgi:hypothetical protein
MKNVRLRRPSPAMLVALAALVLALGGTAVAKFGPFKGDKIIKKRSLSGNRLKNHTLTGNQIKLSTLGKVPSAGSADNATSAGNASNLGGTPAAAFQRAGDIMTAGVSVTPTTATVFKGHGGATATHLAGAGVVGVTFPRDISSCIYLGSVDTVGPAYLNPRKRPSRADQVEVFVYNGAGTGADLPFDLTVIC